MNVNVVDVRAGAVIPYQTVVGTKTAGACSTRTTLKGHGTWYVPTYLTR